MLEVFGFKNDRLFLPCRGHDRRRPSVPTIRRPTIRRPKNGTIGILLLAPRAGLRLKQRNEKDAADRSAVLKVQDIVIAILCATSAKHVRA